MTIAASYLLFLYFRQKQQRKQKHGMLNYTPIKEGSHECSGVTCPLSIGASRHVKACTGT